MRPIEQLKNLLDPDRLAVAGALVARSRSTDELMDATTLDRRATLVAVGALRSAGLVVVDGADHRLDLVELRAIAAALGDEDLPMDPVIGFGMTDEERDVLARFFEGRILREVPTSRAKRRIVLERLALEFEIGRHYPEADVNSILGAFFSDWSTLRRHLVDEGLLDRDKNIYWRSGGRVSGVHRP